jgi:hypothetical protein
MDGSYACVCILVSSFTAKTRAPLCVAALLSACCSRIEFIVLVTTNVAIILLSSVSWLLNT